MSLVAAMSQGDASKLESKTWQPEYLRQYAIKQSEYLDKVADSDVIRHFAERAMERLALSSGVKVLSLAVAIEYSFRVWPRQWEWRGGS
jgi:hypothetical protein